MKLDVYMKSGNVITATEVESWDGKFVGNSISGINIKYREGSHKSGSGMLLVGSMDLSQIEGIVESLDEDDLEYVTDPFAVE